MRKSVLILIILVSVAFSASPENTVAVKITAMDIISRGAANEWFALGQGTANLTLKSKGNSNVKGQLSIEAILGEPSLIDISRAFIKVRFPGFRATLGKTRVSWGEGLFFNAGDLLYGSTSVQADLTSDILRDEAAWLTQVYLPLGTFSFAEAIYLPGDLNLLELIENPSAALPALVDSSVGGRVVGKLMGLKLEGGYLYSGLTNVHDPYLSFQGNLFVDWHLSVAGSFQGGEDPEWEAFLNTVRISAGLFHMQKISSISSISLRLEWLAYPGGQWEENAAGLDRLGVDEGVVIPPLHPNPFQCPLSRQFVHDRPGGPDVDAVVVGQVPCGGHPHGGCALQQQRPVYIFYYRSNEWKRLRIQPREWILSNRMDSHLSDKMISV